MNKFLVCVHTYRYVCAIVVECQGWNKAHYVDRKTGIDMVTGESSVVIKQQLATYMEWQSVRVAFSVCYMTEGILLWSLIQHSKGWLKHCLQST